MARVNSSGTTNIGSPRVPVAKALQVALAVLASGLDDPRRGEHGGHAPPGGLHDHIPSLVEVIEDGHLLAVEALGQDPVGDHQAGLDAGLRLHAGEQHQRLGDRHLLRCGDDRYAGHGRILQEVEHPLRLVTNETHLDEIADHLRRSDLSDDVPGRLGVDDDQVVVPLTHLVDRACRRPGSP